MLLDFQYLLKRIVHIGSYILTRCHRMGSAKVMDWALYLSRYRHLEKEESERRKGENSRHFQFFPVRVFSSDHPLPGEVDKWENTGACVLTLF